MKPLYFPTEIFFEEEVFEDLKNYSDERILIITSRHGVDSDAAQKLVKAAESSNEVHVFNEVKSDPPLSIIAKGTEKIKELEPSVIFALGGGSAMDAAKGMKVDAAFDGDFIAIPTTSGTGSEVNDLAVVTDDDTELKMPQLDDDYQSDKAYLLSVLTVSMPEATTINTGMDVLPHALEAYVAAPMEPAFCGHTTFTDPWVEKAVPLVLENLPKVVENPDDLDARRKMLHASAIASLAFIKAGLGAVHGISHSMGARLKLVHGRINSLLLSDIVQFNAGMGRYETTGQEETAKRYARMAGIVDHTTYDTEEGVERMVELIEDIKKN